MREGTAAAREGTAEGFNFVRFRRVFAVAEGLSSSPERVGLLSLDLYRRLRATPLAKRMSARDPLRPPRPVDLSLDMAHSCLSRADLPGISLVYRLSRPYQLFTCSKEVRGNHFLGPHRIIVYEGQLECGLRFPLLPFFAEVLREFQISPSQIHPNGWKQLVGVYWLCRERGIRLTGAVYRRLYSFVSHHRTDHYIFHPKSVVLTIHSGKTPPVWKCGFFILASPIDFPFPTKWNESACDPKTWAPERELTEYEDNVLNFLTSSGEIIESMNTSQAVSAFLSSGAHVNMF